MTVLFTPYRIYMTVIHIQILRYPLITSFELNPHLKRAHVLLSVISINTKMSLHPSMFWESVIASKTFPWNEIPNGGRFSCPLPWPATWRKPLSSCWYAILCSEVFSAHSAASNSCFLTLLEGYMKAELPTAVGPTSSRIMILLSILEWAL